ncbi:hypothetical protein ACRQ5D_34265 [Mucilaginibacter sp. P25]|uniref:hypothetical protein n=1 Tax=Mucilaginibacter sp. P25 TaxID=3423945 RepID=UPI003D79A7E7
MFDSSAVELHLWKSFAAIVKANDLIESERQINIDEIASVFDELIALTKAVEALVNDPPGKCPICKRSEEVNGEAG